jgi:hypothetical protein
MPSPLKKNLVFKASDEGIVVEWWQTIRWNLLEGYISIGITLAGCCADEDNSLYGPRLLVVSTIMNLLHPTQGD